MNEARIAPAPPAGGAEDAVLDRLRRSFRGRRGIVATVRLAALLALIVIALSTPGFVAKPSMLALVTTMSFIGCVAVGMTLITISGNIMAFCLGTTVAATTLVFALTLPAGLAAAVIVALAFGAAIMALQGLAIGYVRANPIIVSIAALALIYGTAHSFTGGQSIYLERGGAQEALKGQIAGVPIEFLLFAGAVVLGQFLLSATRFGRNLYMVGNSLRAADAAGIRTGRTVTAAYLWAGLFVAMPGIMLASRYNSANMEFGVGYDYDAIAAVLVGGTPIHGGEGAVWRTLIGVAVIATVQAILLLHGFRQEWQYLITGLIVLFVIMLHTVGGRR